MLKKILSLALTVVVFVSALSIPAFATGEGAANLTCPYCGARVQVSRSSISWCQDMIIYMIFPQAIFGAPILSTM